MSSYNDAWFMNESLAFYLSTNTFNNPLFDAMVESSPGAAKQGACNHENPSLGQVFGAKGEGVQSSNWGPKRCTNFCDNLAFTFKSKMYVLELDLKRILQRLRKYTDKRMPWLLNHSQRFPGGLVAGGVSSSSSTSQEPGCGGFGYPMTKDDCRTRDNNKSSWLNNAEPNSIESLGLQKEKILNRLEQAIEEKRSNLNNNKQLFNMNDGLQFVRPIGSSHKATCSSLSSACSSSSSSSSTCSNNGSSCSVSVGPKNEPSSTRSANKRRWNFSAGQQQLAHGHLQADGSSNKAPTQRLRRKLLAI